MGTKAIAIATLLPLAIAFSAQAANHAVGDYDGDGRSDVFWRNSRTGINAIWKHASASNVAAVARLASPDWRVAGRGDFDGDGRSDVFWRNVATGANMIWNSGNAATSHVEAGLTDRGWKVVGVADFDGDGKSDVLWRNDESGANRIWKSARPSGLRVISSVPSHAWKVVGAGDFDGDGKSDVFWRNTRSGADAIWKSANAATPQAVKAVTDQDWKVVAVGDFTGDGKSDVFWRNTWSGANTIWTSGNASAPLATQANPDLGWQVTEAGDFDGDGTTDVLWRNFNTGANEIWRSGNASTRQAVAATRDLTWLIVPDEAQIFSLLSVADVSIDEGNSGTRQLAFTVKLSRPSDSPVGYHAYTGDYYSNSEVETALAETDYIARDLPRQVIPAGKTAATITVAIRGDTTAEANELFALLVGEVAGAVPIHDVAAGTIRNDDANTFWITNGRVVEGDSGTRPMAFTIKLSRPSTTAVTYDFATADYPGGGLGLFHATAGIDYVASQASQSFPAGTTRKTITVTIIGDTRWEPVEETFKLDVSNVSDTVVLDGQAEGHIIDDEPPIIP